MTGEPLFSVVIPTAGARPTLLKRAIKSAFQSFADKNGEILIVPNGPEPVWRESVTAWRGVPGIRICPAEVNNVSAARNCGVSNARGQLLRFLDDDDFLVPDVAAKQWNELLASDADVSSYSIRIEAYDGRRFETLRQPDTTDFVSGQLGPHRLQLPHAHVFKLSRVAEVKWDENFKVSEDIAWLHAICAQGEVTWIRGDDVVGVWYQHAGPRLTYPYAAHEPHRNTAESILGTTTALRGRGRLTDIRRRAAAAGLWDCVHRGFYLRPRYWHGIARMALELDPASYPDHPLYRQHHYVSFSPLFIEWIMLPKRRLNHLFRQAHGRLFGWDPVRRI